VFSDDGRYRYFLSRPFARKGRTICWIMLNPSTADAEKNDPTVRRCLGFSKELRWDGRRIYSSMYVLNLFALRSTDPKALREVDDPIGPDNDAWILRTASRSDLVVCAWGSHGAHLRRGVNVIGMLRERQVKLHCLGTTKAGYPKHPLYLRSGTALEELR
jgi:hypothetical protein